MKLTTEILKYRDLKKQYSNVTTELNKKLIRGDACHSLSKEMLRSFLNFCDRKDKMLINRIRFLKVQKSVICPSISQARKYRSEIYHDVKFHNKTLEIFDNIIVRVK
jgi:hypothetical protein